MIGKHEYTATLAVPEGYVAMPGYDVEHDAETVYSNGFDTDLDGWTPDAASTELFLTDYAPHSGVQSVAIESTAPVSNVILSRTIEGLTIGRDYTLTAWARRQLGSALVVVQGTTPGYAYGDGSTEWQEITYSFTATATSHPVSLAFSIGGTGQGDWGNWDDVKIVQDAWTEHVPDQIAYTYELHINDGAAALDEGWSPYVQCDLTVTTPPPEMLDRLDPRDSPRVTVEASAYAVAPGQTVETSTRTLDLLLRARTIDHNAGTTALTLAGDDATLQDYKLIGAEPDSSSLGYQDSVRAIVNGVLGRAGLPALQPGDADADFTTLDARTNLMLNPSAEVNADNWAPGGGCTIARTTDWALSGSYCITATATGSSGAVFANSTSTYPSATPGTAYSTSIYVRSNTAGVSATVTIRFLNAAGAQTNTTSSSSVVNTSGWTRLSTTATAPSDANRWAVYVSFAGTQVGRKIYLDAAMMTEGNGLATDGVSLLEYFDGSTPDTALYNYTWSDPAKPNASSSVRTPVFDRSPDTLLWQPGESGWDFLQPILTQSGLRLFCDESRNFYLVDNTYSVEGLVTVQTGDNLYTAQDTVDRTATAPDGSPLWFDAVVIKYTWNDQDNVQQVRYDTASVDNPTQPALIEYARPYPGPGAAKYILSRVTGQGRKLDLTARMDFAVTPGMAFSATLPVTETQTGYVSSVKWSIGSDDMTVGTRGLIDTPASAWIFLDPGETWNDSPVGASWIDEVA